jgi:hypothetical protein
VRSGKTRSPARLIGLGSAIALATLAVLAASAEAAGTVSITVGADPTESITTQLGVTGTNPSKSNAFALKVKTSGGEGCGANPSADKGELVLDEYTSGSQGSGPHSASVNWNFRAAGSYLLCAWMLEGGSSGWEVIASTSATIAVRPPHLTVAISAPPVVRPAQTFQIATTAQAETQRTLVQYVLPNTGRGCPANAEAAESTPSEQPTYWPAHGEGWSVTGGPFTESFNESFASVGVYLVCAYFEYPASASPPEAMASAQISVVRPPPACVVPHLSRTTTLHSIEAKLRASHCAIGRVRYLASARHARGSVIALSPAPGSHLANGARVAIVVSTGRPHPHRAHH